MTPRSIRRAAERRANKLARKAAQQAVGVNTVAAETPETAPVAAPEIIPAAVANEHLTAATSALTGQITLLPAADASSYDQLLCDYQAEFQPVGLQESNLVQSLAETTWRMRRVVSIEMAIFAQGRIEFAEQFAEHKPELRVSLFELHTFLTYEKQIRALQLQESRFSRRIDKQTAELRGLQKERRERETAERQSQLQAAAQLYLDAQRNHQPFHPVQNGFAFSNQEIESFLAKKQAAKERFSAMRGLPLHAEAA